MKTRNETTISLSEAVLYYDEVPPLVGCSYMCQADQVRALAGATGHSQAAILREMRRQAGLRQSRQAANQADPLSVSIQTRLLRHLRSISERARRASGAPAPTGWTGGYITDRDIPGRMWIVNAEYKYEYSRRFGAWWTGASYLCGYDDSGLFCIRVPRSITKVGEALDWITPAAVKAARAAGKRVLRQGDVWAVETKRDCARDRDLPSPHRWDSTTRTITHPEHAPVTVPFPCKLYSNRQITGGGGD